MKFCKYGDRSNKVGIILLSLHNMMVEVKGGGGEVGLALCLIFGLIFWKGWNKGYLQRNSIRRFPSSFEALFRKNSFADQLHLFLARYLLVFLLFPRTGRHELIQVLEILPRLQNCRQESNHTNSTSI
jgi:hypothetical protein